MIYITRKEEMRMVQKAEKPKKRGRYHDIEIVFKNKLSPESWRKFRESVISANMQEHVPAHFQQPLLDKFVDVGLMAP